jgi:hypothetical protein
MDGFPAWKLGEGLIIPHRKEQHVMKCYTRPQIWIDSLE